MTVHPPGTRVDLTVGLAAETRRMQMFVGLSGSLQSGCRAGSGGEIHGRDGLVEGSAGFL